VFVYLEDRELMRGSELDRAMLSPTNFAAAVEGEKARQRTRDALATSMAEVASTTAQQCARADRWLAFARRGAHLER
jgi:hypothetical protein